MPLVVRIVRDSGIRILPSKYSGSALKNDLLEVFTPGGGGYGTI
jgi:hypothetical protein